MSELKHIAKLASQRIVTSSASVLLGLIIKAALQNRETRSLIHAYVDDLRDDWEENDEVNDSDDDPEERWQQHIKMVEKASDVEKLFTDVYVKVYRRYVPNMSREDAMGVMQYPDRLPRDSLPRLIVVEVAKALAMQDAADANALRREFIRRQQRA